VLTYRPSSLPSLLLVSMFALSACRGGQTAPMPAAPTSEAADISLDQSAEVAPDAGGVCAKIAVRTLGHEPFVKSTLNTVLPGAVTIELVGPQSETFVVTPENAKGQPIVPVPSVKLVTIGTSKFLSSNITIDGLGNNQFKLTSIAHPSLRTTQIVPEGPACMSILPQLLKSPINGVLSSAIYVYDTGAVWPGQTGLPAVRVYDENGSRISPPGAFSGPLPTAPLNGLAYDPFLARLYLPTGDGVGTYDLNGNAVTVSGGFPGIDGDPGDAFDTTNRELFVGNVLDPESLTIYNESGSLVATETQSDLVNGPFALTFDSHLNRIYVRLANATVTSFTGSGAEIKPPGGFPAAGGSDGIAYASFNNLIYVPNLGSMKVYNENGTQISEPAGAFSGLNAVIGIGIDTFADVVYASNCPARLKTNSTTPGFVTAYAGNGSAHPLPPGAFQGNLCPGAITAAAP
jgi:hypothetical protein